MNRNAVWTLLLVVGCADLTEMDTDGRCGNKILEMASGEDCDTFAKGDNTVCGTSGAGACRYLCGENATDAVCPADWICGGGICRSPSDSFEEADSAIPLMTQRPGDLHLGDINGDGRKDLIAIGNAVVIVRLGDDQGNFSREVRFNTDTVLGSAAVTDLDDDGRDDLVIPQLPAPLVVRGMADGTLDPYPYPLASDMNSPIEEDLRFLPMRLDPFYLWDNLIAIRHKLDASTYKVGVPLEEGEVQIPFSTYPTHCTTCMLARDIAVGQLDATYQQELAVSFSGGSSVTILAVDPAPFFAQRVLAEVPIQQQQDCWVWNGVHLAELNGDGHTDLLIHVECRDMQSPDFPTSHIEVAFGDGTGQRFCPTPSDLACQNNGTSAVKFRIDEDYDRDRYLDLLATANLLEANQRTELIFSDLVLTVTGIRTNPVGGLTFDVKGLAMPRSVQVWDQVGVGDFNKDGRMDIAATYLGDTAVEFLLQSPQVLFNRNRASTPAQPVSISVGDYDGDFFPDLAVFDQNDELHVLFGDPQGAPSEIVSMGMFESLIWMQQAQIILFGIDVDLISDLIMVTETEAEAGRTTKQVTVLKGTSERRMLSGLVFMKMKAPPEHGKDVSAVPTSIHAGLFAGDDTIIDLVATAFPEGEGQPDPNGEDNRRQDLQVWLAKGSGGADFDNNDMKFTNITGECRIMPGCTTAHAIPGTTPRIALTENGALCNELVGEGLAGPFVIELDLVNMNATCDRLTPASSLANREGLKAVEYAGSMDLDGDGHLDFLVGHAGGIEIDTGFRGVPEPIMHTEAGIIVYYGPVESLETPEELANDLGATAFSPIDLDHDGTLELAVTGMSGTQIIRTNRDGSYEVLVTLAAPDLLELQFVRPNTIVADANNDGLEDILLFDGEEVEVFFRKTCSAQEAADGDCERTEPGEED